MIRFAAASCSVVWLLVFSTGILRGAEGSREQPSTIRIAYVSPVTTMAPIWIARGLDQRKPCHMSRSGLAITHANI